MFAIVFLLRFNNVPNKLLSLLYNETLSLSNHIYHDRNVRDVVDSVEGLDLLSMSVSCKKKKEEK